MDKLNMSSSEPILKTAINVFSEINEKINSLIDCSARDFDILNSYFKEYHTKIKSLTEITDGIFKEINNLTEKELESGKQLLKQNKTLIREYSTYINDLLKTFIQFDKGISYAFLYTNNLKQNAYTLKLLTTNLQFEPKLGMLYKEIIKIIEDLMTCISNLEHDFVNLEKRNLICSTTIERIIIQQIPTIQHAEDKLKSEWEILMDKKIKSTEYQTSLDKLTSESNMQSSEIITNLQFQDITRQKIEHVRTAHETILAKLKDIYSEKKSHEHQSWQLSVEMLTRIRDIGSLQAAQLIHANHEYQRAIENITRKFNDLDETMSKTQTVLQELTDTGDNHEEFNIRNIEKAFSVVELEQDTLIGENKELYHSINDLLRKKENLLDSRSNIDCIFENIEGLEEKLGTVNQESKKNASKVSPPVIQLLRGIDELRRNTMAINDLINYDKLNLSVLTNEMTEKNSQLFSKIEENQEMMHKLSLSLASQESHTNNAFNYKLKDKHNSTTEISLGQVKYYKVFEKEIESIILKINDLVNKINFDDLQKEVPAEELKKLKELYTMESERKVHNFFTGENSMSEDDTEDDIELF